MHMTGRKLIIRSLAIAMLAAPVTLAAPHFAGTAAAEDASDFLEKLRKKKAERAAKEAAARNEAQRKKQLEQAAQKPVEVPAEEPVQVVKAPAVTAPEKPALFDDAVGEDDAVVAGVAPKVVAKTTTQVVMAPIDGKQSPMLFAESGSVMRDAYARYQQVVGRGGFQRVTRNVYKKGSDGKGVAALNQRLFQEGYLRAEATQGQYAQVFTSATDEALRRYQQNLGLPVTGKTDAATVAALNVPAEVRLRAIQANMPRLDVYAENLGERYLVVNVPAQQLETVENGNIRSRHNAIVGRKERPTPVAMTALSDINFNPYWNAPPSIIERDIFPKLVTGTQILDDMNIRVFQGFGGPEVDPKTVDWRNAVADDYHFRQEPGEHNAMATAKINFPSPFGIYLHDTPEKHLFNTGNRFYSSGCVRVQNMSNLVAWVLNGQDGVGPAEIDTLAETLERRDVKLSTPPQLRVIYLTAWPARDGTVAFRDDVYQLDGTGFTVGQPMPVGETSPDGQRFVLKPIPRLAAQVDDDGGGGFFSFTRKSKSGDKKDKSSQKKSLFSVTGDSVSAVDEDAIVPAKPAKKVVTPAKGKQASGKAKSSKDVPGLFDWETWRKEQKLAAKSGKVKPKAKKTEKADAKKPDDKKLAAKSSAKKVDDKTKLAAKKAVDKAKPDDKKVAAADAKKSTSAEKPAVKSAEKAKVTKPAVKKAECKPDKDGKLPKECKVAEVDKKLVDKGKKPAAAAN